MSTVTPGSWLKPVEAFSPESKTMIGGSTLIPDDRVFVPKPYVLRDHLTDKPFKNNTRLSELRDKMKGITQ